MGGSRDDGGRCDEVAFERHLVDVCGALAVDGPADPEGREHDELELAVAAGVAEAGNIKDA